MTKQPTQPKTNAERQKASDDRHRALGRKGRKVWATPEEFIVVNRILHKLRENL
jgi:hypothetical protein